MMRAPAFWQKDGLLPTLLAPFGALGGAIAARRMAQAGSRAAIPVICIGNFTAGGAGKTPTAIALAGMLRHGGRRPVFLTRGYGGRITAPTLVDPSRHRAGLVGDEPLLLARHAPTVVAADRVAGATLAAALGDILVMDDGLQNPALAKDLRIAVVDGATGIGNGRCIPAGPLRAPLAAQLAQVEAVVVIGPGAAGQDVAAAARAQGVAVLRATLRPDRAMAAALAAGPPVLAFAGIGRPQKFFDTLSAAGVTLAGTLAYGDHRPYARADIAALFARAATAKARLATTEKDWVRLDTVLLPGEAEMIAVLPVTLGFEDPAAMARLAGAIGR